MKVKTLLFLLGFLISTASFGQNVRYATSVINYSSQYQVGSWSANQVLGAPDVYPLYEDNINAWASLTSNQQREYLEVGFDNPAPIDSIWIFETYYAGSIDTVYVKNPNTNQWQVVYQGPIQDIQEARIMRVGFPMTTFPVSQVRITMDSQNTTYWNEIDAIAIGSNTNIVVGTEELTLNEKVFAYPNPTLDNQSTIEFIEVKENVEITLVDFTGKIISTANYSGVEKVNIELPEAKGVYFVQILVDGKSKTIKLINQ